jgi:putative cell wall-binding protein
MEAGVTRATKRLRRSSVAGLAALATVGGALVAAAGTAGATSTATVTRIAGTDRYDTAAQLAAKAFPNGATNVIIASGAAAHFPDALSGNYLAGQLNAPILLTSSTGAMPASTTNALTALHPTKVYILGDANAVPTAQETALTTAGYTVVRLGGTDRYQTNLKVLQAVGSAGTVGGVTTGIVASGANFPDALSAGPLAFASKLPIILTDPVAPSSTVATAISRMPASIVDVAVRAGPSSAAVSVTVRARRSAGTAGTR